MYSDRRRNNVILLISIWICRLHGSNNYHCPVAPLAGDPSIKCRNSLRRSTNESQNIREWNVIELSLGYSGRTLVRDPETDQVGEYMCHIASNGLRRGLGFTTINMKYYIIDRVKKDQWRPGPVELRKPRCYWHH